MNIYQIHSIVLGKLNSKLKLKGELFSNNEKDVPINTLFFNPLVSYGCVKSSDWIDENNVKNMLNPGLLEAFPNVTRLEIKWIGPFSSLKFSSVIKGTSIKHVLFSGISEEGTYSFSFNEQIMRKYEAANFKIDLFKIEHCPEIEIRSII